MSQKMSSATVMIGALRSKSILIQIENEWCLEEKDPIVFAKSEDKIRLCSAQSDLVLAFRMNNFHSSRATTRCIISIQAFIVCRLIHG